MSNKSKVREEVIRFCYPMKDRIDSGFIIYKIEAWDVLRKHRYSLSPKLISAKFIVVLPGLTVSDLIQGDELGKSEIRDAIDILQKYRLVKASSYGNEIRYIIADNDLNNFINAIKNYFISELDFRLHVHILHSRYARHFIVKRLFKGSIPGRVQYCKMAAPNFYIF
jgi:hypothetical protein